MNEYCQTEVLTRDRSQLTDQQKLQLLESHSPELLGLAAELREKLVELRLRINPLTELLNKSADIKVLAAAQLLLDPFLRKY